jgi:DNA-binding GntR family transcriptional regulator
VIFAAAGHDIAWEIVQRLNGRISRLRALTLASTNRRVSGPAHMARIAGAIAANDPAAAARAVRDHLKDAAEIARTLLEAP